MGSWLLFLRSHPRVQSGVNNNHLLRLPRGCQSPKIKNQFHLKCVIMSTWRYESLNVTILPVMSLVDHPGITDHIAPAPKGHSLSINRVVCWTYRNHFADKWNPPIKYNWPQHTAEGRVYNQISIGRQHLKAWIDAGSIDARGGEMVTWCRGGGERRVFFK